MYLQELYLKNIKGFRDVSLRFPRPKQTGNWHVILGDNGTGKTTILQAIALSLVDAQEMLDHPEDWVRHGTTEGECQASVSLMDAKPIGLKYTVFRPSVAGDVLMSKDDVFERDTPAALGSSLRRNATIPPILVAGYGALRRMEIGGSKSRHRPTLEDTVRSLFDPVHEFTDLENWLMRLDYLSKDADRPADQRETHKARLRTICQVVDSLLPKDPILLFQGVNSEGALFIGPDGAALGLKNLSEGYRAVFAIAVDLIFLAHLSAPDEKLFARDHEGRPYVNLEGIVLIDEVDTHLHPKWQQQIGPYLMRAFPKVQFIVTTHSPFVAQAATEGGLFVLEWSRDGVTVDQPPSAVQTWAAEEILESSVFGLESTRKPEIEQDLNEYTRLKARAEAGTLTDTEKKRLQALKKRLKPALPPPGSAEETLKEIERRIREAGKQP